MKTDFCLAGFARTATLLRSRLWSHLLLDDHESRAKSARARGNIWKSSISCTDRLLTLVNDIADAPREEAGHQYGVSCAICLVALLLPSFATAPDDRSKAAHGGLNVPRSAAQAGRSQPNSLNHHEFVANATKYTSPNDLIHITAAVGTHSEDALPVRSLSALPPLIGGDRRLMITDGHQCRRSAQIVHAFTALLKQPKQQLAGTGLGLFIVRSLSS
jgi:signal transduction histidine kinase